MATWSSGLLGCLDDKASMLDTWCCWPCQIGYQFGALNGTPGEMSKAQCFMSMIGLFQCCACLLRRGIAEQFNLDEGAAISCCVAWICPHCSICQTHRELKFQNRPPGGICVNAAAAGAAMAGGGGKSIMRAVYHETDVTERVKQEVRNGALYLNGDFNGYFGDPAYGVPKKLKIFLSNMEEFTYSEGETVNIQLGVNITRAVYHETDVTGRVQQEVRDGQLNLTGDFNGYFGDPAYGVPKKLHITLSDGRELTYSEGESVSISGVC